MSEDTKQVIFSPKPRGVVAVVAVMLALFLLAAAIKEFKSISYVGRDVGVTNTINVSGTGEAFQAPDLATFTFTVQEETLVVSDAQNKVNTQVADILSFLKKNGVAEKDIRTLGYNIYPRYEYSSAIYPGYPQGKQTLAGYVVSQNVEVKVRKLTDAGTIVGSMGELGATDVSGLQFTVDKEDAVLREARQKAIEDAQTKATQLAKDLGVKLVRIVNFSESGNYPYPVYYAKGMGAMSADSAPAQLPSGENQFISNVSITYEIR